MAVDNTFVKMQPCILCHFITFNSTNVHCRIDIILQQSAIPKIHLHYNCYFSGKPGLANPPQFSSFTCSFGDKWHYFYGTYVLSVTQPRQHKVETANQWPGFILSSPTNRLLHCSLCVSSNVTVKNKIITVLIIYEC